MKLIALTIVIFVFNGYITGQQLAVVAETGQEVLLYADGSWQYKEVENATIVQKDTTSYTKPKQADFLVKSTKIDVGVWIDKKKWNYTRSKEGSGSAAEYMFNLTGQDAYAMIIPERIEIPIENLLDIAYQNAERAAPDIQVIKKEIRLVNGKPVHFMQMEGTLQGIKFVYFGYYYSFEKGSVQLLAYTAKNLLKNYEKDLELFLNGFEPF